MERVAPRKSTPPRKAISCIARKPRVVNAPATGDAVYPVYRDNGRPARKPVITNGRKHSK